MMEAVHGWCRAGAAATTTATGLVQRRQQPLGARLRLRVVGAGAGSSRNGWNHGASGLEGLGEEARRAAKTVADKAQHLLKDFQQRSREFQDDHHVGDRVRRFTRAANQKMEDMGFEMRRNADKWNRRHRVTHRAAEFVDYVKDQLHAADSRLRIRQRARVFGIDVRMKWPTYRRQLSQFLDTPLGKLLSTILFAWFVLSGWIFKVFVLSMWLLPIAAPLLIGTIARNTIVEGACPNCKTQFIGSRSQVIVCRSCRNVVWQPRDDFSKGTEDPSIIDIDVED